MTITVPYPLEQTGRNGMALVAACSILLHGAALVGVPVLMGLLRPPARHFSKPQAFQVVTLPRTEAAAAVRPKAQARPARAAHPSAKPSARQEVKKEEEVGELEQLLQEIPSAARISTSAAGFKYDWYLRALEEKIKRFWNPPMHKEGIQVLVSFTVKLDGAIVNVRLAESCGNPTLDNLALRAVTLAGPVSKVPPGYSVGDLPLTIALVPSPN